MPVLIAACVDEADDDSDAPACPTWTQQLTGAVHRHGTASGPVADASVCVVGRANLPCALSNSAGEVALCVPEAGDFALVVSKPGHESVVHPLASGHTEAFLEMGDDGFVSSLWAKIPGATYPPTTDAHLVVIVSSPEVAELEVVPEDGIGPVYSDAQQTPDPDLTGTVASGVVYVANVPPRWYSARVSTPSNLRCTHVRCVASDCHPGGWPSLVPGHLVAMPAIAGATTVVVIACAP